jgi:hypothetical protein
MLRFPYLEIASSASWLVPRATTETITTAIAAASAATERSRSMERTYDRDCFVVAHLAMTAHVLQPSMVPATAEFTWR